MPHQAKSQRAKPLLVGIETIPTAVWTHRSLDPPQSGPTAVWTHRSLGAIRCLVPASTWGLTGRSFENRSRTDRLSYQTWRARASLMSKRSSTCLLTKSTKRRKSLLLAPGLATK